MKKILFVAFMLLLLAPGYAQLKFKEDGKVNIGIEPTEDIELEIWRQDTITTLKLFGKHGELKCGSRLSFGDMTRYNLNALIGEFGTYDSDLLWLQATHGYYFTSASQAQDTICFYDSNKGNYFQFNCDVRAMGLFVASDSRFKENITPIDNTLSKLHQLSAVSYQLKNDTPTAMAARSSHGGGSAKEQKNAEFYSTFCESKKNEPARFGFIAQEVKEIYPELVRSDSAGYMYVDYIGMVPLLVNAVNEFKAKADSQDLLIAELQNEIADLQGGSPKGNKKKNVDNRLGGELIPKLHQNTPNPFSSSTIIRFALPQTIQQAYIYIYDMQGQQIQKIEITERGENSISVQGENLAAGMYIYSLIADNEEIDSKRMILTK